jgi:hypothetical protein
MNTTHRPGSLPHRVSLLAPGEHLTVAVREGDTYSKAMQSLGGTLRRAGLVVNLAAVTVVELAGGTSSREVRVTRSPT